MRVEILAQGTGKVKRLYISENERIDYAHRHSGRGYELQRKRRLWKFSWWETVADIQERGITSAEQLQNELHEIEQANILAGLEGCVF
jgi:pyrimidine operon attenuation protein/uracil phosphoribosyltransferase